MNNIRFPQGQGFDDFDDEDFAREWAEGRDAVARGFAAQWAGDTGEGEVAAHADSADEWGAGHDPERADSDVFASQWAGTPDAAEGADQAAAEAAGVNVADAAAADDADRAERYAYFEQVEYGEDEPAAYRGEEPSAPAWSEDSIGDGASTADDVPYPAGGDDAESWSAEGADRAEGTAGAGEVTSQIDAINADPEMPTIIDARSLPAQAASDAVSAAPAGMAGLTGAAAAGLAAAGARLGWGRDDEDAPSEAAEGEVAEERDEEAAVLAETEVAEDDEGHGTDEALVAPPAEDLGSAEAELDAINADPEMPTIIDATHVPEAYEGEPPAADQDEAELYAAAFGEVPSHHVEHEAAQHHGGAPTVASLSGAAAAGLAAAATRLGWHHRDDHPDSDEVADEQAAEQVEQEEADEEADAGYIPPPADDLGSTEVEQEEAERYAAEHGEVPSFVAHHDGEGEPADSVDDDTAEIPYLANTGMWSTPTLSGAAAAGLSSAGAWLGWGDDDPIRTIDSAAEDEDDLDADRDLQDRHSPETPQSPASPGEHDAADSDPRIDAVNDDPEMPTIIDTTHLDLSGGDGGEVPPHLDQPSDAGDVEPEGHEAGQPEPDAGVAPAALTGAAAAGLAAAGAWLPRGDDDHEARSDAPVPSAPEWYQSTEADTEAWAVSTEAAVAAHEHVDHAEHGDGDEQPAEPAEEHLDDLDTEPDEIEAESEPELQPYERPDVELATDDDPVSPAEADTELSGIGGRTVVDSEGQIVDVVDEDRSEALREIDADPELPRVIDATGPAVAEQATADRESEPDRDPDHDDDEPRDEPQQSDAPWFDKALRRIEELFDDDGGDRDS